MTNLMSDLGENEKLTFIMGVLVFLAPFVVGAFAMLCKIVSLLDKH